MYPASHEDVGGEDVVVVVVVTLPPEHPPGLAAAQVTGSHKKPWNRGSLSCQYINPFLL